MASKASLKRRIERLESLNHQLSIENDALTSEMINASHRIVTITDDVVKFNPHDKLSSSKVKEYKDKHHTDFINKIMEYVTSEDDGKVIHLSIQIIKPEN